MRWRTTFIVAFLLLGLTGFSAWAEKRVALVIGNSAYQNVARLANSANDAAAIADLLQKAGFDTVELNRDLTTAEIMRALEGLAHKSRNADIAVVYFAGHSIEIDGMTYLAPTDVSPDAPGDAIRLDRVLHSVEGAKVLRLIVVDACHGNPFVPGSGAACAPSHNLAAMPSSRPNTVIAFAAKTATTTRDSGGANSPFTAALLKHLTADGLDLQQALARVHDEVLKATGNSDEPFVVGSVSGPNLAPVSSSAAVSETRGAATPKTAAEGSSAKQQREDPSKVDALDRVHMAMQVATAERIARDKAEAEARAAKAREQAETTGSVREGKRVAALPDTAGGITQRELNRSLQIELRRVGCQTGPASDDWTATSRRGLELFNKHAGLKLEIKLASRDALDVVKSRQVRVCP
jgi:uncharacterized caspase-like protein